MTSVLLACSVYFIFGLYIHWFYVEKWREWCLTAPIWLKNISFMNLLDINCDRKFTMPLELPHFSCEFTQMSSDIFLNSYFCLSAFPMVLSILLTSSNFVPCLRILCCFHNKIIWIWNPPWFHWCSSFSIFYKLSENVVGNCWEDMERVIGMCKSCE